MLVDMKFLTLLYSIVLFTVLYADGPFNVGFLDESDGLRNGPDYFGAALYYPTDAMGPLPSIAIVPGFLTYASSVEAWGPYLASYGIVTMIIGTNYLSDYPEERADALLDALETIRQENSRQQSPLNGNLDINRFSVGGWSMGGGGAQLAAMIDPTIKAIMAICPWLDNYSLNPADLNHDIPVLIFSGEYDNIAPPSAHANIHYSYTPMSTPKLLFEIENGDHTIANNPSGGGGDVGEVANAWLQTYLVGDDSYCSQLLEVPSSASEYTTNIECDVFIIGDINNDESLNILDVILLVNLILEDEYALSADLNSDNAINVQDIILLINIILNY